MYGIRNISIKDTQKREQGILSQLNKNVPDCVSEHLNFQKFLGEGGKGACPRTPLIVRAFVAQLGRYTPKLSPPAFLSSTSTLFDKENPAQREAEQGKQLFLGIFIVKSSMFF